MSRPFFLPLQRVEVRYLVRHGRRWSALEHLLLWACIEPKSARGLAVDAGVPLRLVSECLVNLLRANWIELRSTEAGVVFAATRAGREAAGQATPEHIYEKQRRTSHLFMERLSGAYFTQSELTPIRRGHDQFREADAVSPLLFQTIAFGPELVDLLYFGEDDTFERLLERPLLVPGDWFAMLHVTPDGIEGLPPRTPTAVSLAIQEAAQRLGHPSFAMPIGQRPSQGPALGKPLRERGRLRSCQFVPEDLIVGGQAHLDAALAVIGGASRLVVIHSTFVGRHFVQLLPALADAATTRGVQIYINWGKDDDPEGIAENPSAVAARQGIGALPLDVQRQFRCGARTSGSHAKVIIADKGDDTYVALVGSCNWLDSPYKSVEASVRVSAAPLIGDIALMLAALLAPATGEEEVVAQLLDLHSRCQRADPEPGLHHAMLISDQDHYTAVRDAMHDVGHGQSVLLGSHKYGASAETTVFDPMREAARYGARVRLFYTRAIDSAERPIELRQQELAEKGIELRRGGEMMHAKFLAWNDTALITSFNFLSGAVSAHSRRGDELGVLLTGPGIVGTLERKLTEAGVVSDVKAGRRRRGRRRRAGQRSGEMQHGGRPRAE